MTRTVDSGARRAGRKQLGAWYTPTDLVDRIVDAVVTEEFVDARSRRVRALDPACGDGRFLAAVDRRVRELGGTATIVGVDVDPGAVTSARTALPAADVRCADSLEAQWHDERFDLVIGNPPFLSQLAASTTRGGAGRRGGGPYGDQAVQFLALGAELVEPNGGRLAMVLPQSALSSRDAAGVRASIDRSARMCWSWWSPERVFDAQVYTCVVAFEFGAAEAPCARRTGDWSAVVTERGGVPALPAAVATDGTLGDRATLNANFRDEYYGLVPAVVDDGDGEHGDSPPLITSGLIDPGVDLWGRRAVRFAKQRFAAPRVRLDLLDEPMQRWAERRLVPKVLVANQTSVIEAFCDADGTRLPGVPVVGVYPTGAHWDDRADDASRPGSDPQRDARCAVEAWRIAAVLTSPYASIWWWHRSAGTGLSASAVRASPTVLADLPWPSGDLEPAVAALVRGDVLGCGRSVQRAYGLDGDTAQLRWWSERIERIASRQPAIV